MASILPSRYPSRVVYEVIPPEEAALYKVPFEHARNLRLPELDSYLSRGLNPLPPHIATAILMTVLRANLRGRRLDQGMDETAEADWTHVLTGRLLLAGANPFQMLANRTLGNKAARIRAALIMLPPGNRADYYNFNLAHALCRCEEFVLEILPVLREFKTNLNAVCTLPSHRVFGTPGHIILANERFDEATAYFNATHGELDPSVRDGEGKTLAILAAKLGSERMLLLLAKLYPDNLDLTAQDEHGRTAAHYCFILGLHKAAPYFVNFEVMNARDVFGRTPADYLMLSTPSINAEAADIMRSIEIEPTRDAGAPFNAISFDRTGRAVIVDFQPLLCVQENFAAAQQAKDPFRETDVAWIIEQRASLQGISRLEAAVRGRSLLRRNYWNGLTAPFSGLSRNHAQMPVEPATLFGGQSIKYDLPDGSTSYIGNLIPIGSTFDRDPPRAMVSLEFQEGVGVVVCRPGLTLPVTGNRAPTSASSGDEYMPRVHQRLPYLFSPNHLQVARELLATSEPGTLLDLTREAVASSPIFSRALQHSSRLVA